MSEDAAKKTNVEIAKLNQSLVDPRCLVDEKGFPVFDLLYISDPSTDGEYVRSVAEAVNSHASLVKRITELEKALGYILRIRPKNFCIQVKEEAGLEHIPESCIWCRAESIAKAGGKQ